MLVCAGMLSFCHEGKRADDHLQILHNYFLFQPEMKHIECPCTSLWVLSPKKAETKGWSLQVFPFRICPPPTLQEETKVNENMVIPLAQE